MYVVMGVVSGLDVWCVSRIHRMFDASIYAQSQSQATYIYIQLPIHTQLHTYTITHIHTWFDNTIRSVGYIIIRAPSVTIVIIALTWVCKARGWSISSRDIMSMGIMVVIGILLWDCL